MFPKEESGIRVRIKAGHGYWDTTRYPLGGDFRRAPSGGTLVENVKPLASPIRGCTHYGCGGDGRVAFDIDNTEAATIEDALIAECTLEPLRCRHCGSLEVTYHQGGIEDGYCAECGRWQLEGVR